MKMVPRQPSQEGRAQLKLGPQHTHPQRTPWPGVAGYKPSAHTNTRRAQHPSQEWRGAAATRSQAHTPTPRSQARIGGVPAERVHKHTHPPTPQPGVAGCSPKAEPKHTHPRRTTRPGVAGHKRSAHTSTQRPRDPARSDGAQPNPEHKHTHPRRTPQHPSQEGWSAAETRAQAQPRPKHNRHTTVGKRVSIARALGQPANAGDPAKRDPETGGKAAS